MSEVDELRTRGRGLGGLLEVVESRAKYREVVEVDRDGGARFRDLDGLHCLLARHRDYREQEGSIQPPMRVGLYIEAATA